jgi:hypothetical protein
MLPLPSPNKLARLRRKDSPKYFLQDDGEGTISWALLPREKMPSHSQAADQYKKAKTKKT